MWRVGRLFVSKPRVARPIVRRRLAPVVACAGIALYALHTVAAAEELPDPSPRLPLPVIQDKLLTFKEKYPGLSHSLLTNTIRWDDH